MPDFIVGISQLEFGYPPSMYGCKEGRGGEGGEGEGDGGCKVLLAKVG